MVYMTKEKTLAGITIMKATTGQIMILKEKDVLIQTIMEYAMIPILLTLTAWIITHS